MRSGVNIIPSFSLLKPETLESCLRFRLRIDKVGIIPISEYSTLFRHRNNLDLLFFHRKLKRLIAIELKIGKFKPAYMGQMRFYLKWLNKFERQDGENSPIGLILCTEASREQIELMELDKEGIAVAEYWTQLPPKSEFERKINELYKEAQERLERRTMLPNSSSQREIEYFYEPKDDNCEQ